MRRATPLLFCLAILVLIVASGCRNPFDPEADVKLVRFYSTDNQYVETIVQDTASNLIDQSWRHIITLQLYNYSSVGVKFHSYTVVYRQVGAQTSVIPNVPPGQPIATLGGAAGRRYMAEVYIRGLANNGSEFIDEQVPILMLTEDVFTYISNNADTTSGGMDVDISLFGADDNDHDIVINGTFHIEVL